MEWIIKANSIKGNLKRGINDKCQDKIYSIKNKESICIALADGVSCAYGDLGAEIAVKIACEYMEKHFDELFVFSEEKTKYEVLCAVVRALRKASITGNYHLKSLASTLSIVGIKNNRYISIFLGDGTIGKIENEKLDCISYFDSTKSRKHKYLTTTSECYNRVKIRKGYSDNIDLFFILSDGTIDYFYDSNEDKIYKNLSKIIKKEYANIADELNNELVENNSIDDCSYIIAYKVNDI